MSKRCFPIEEKKRLNYISGHQREFCRLNPQYKIVQRKEI